MRLVSPPLRQGRTTGENNVDNSKIVTIIIVMMAPSKRFDIIYPPIIKQHLKSIEPKFYSLIRVSLERSLQHQPDLETKNRKPLKRPVVFGAKWELRFGTGNRLRAFYRIDYENSQVLLLAIGQKIENRLFIGGEEVEL
jgi:hypothetical protein